jgi:hypothetical protein
VNYIVCCSSGSPYIGPPPCPAAFIKLHYVKID